MKYCRVNGIDYYYEDIGSKKDTILLLHGLGTSSKSWLYQTTYFKKEYRIIAPDLRGEGKTSLGNTPYSFSLCADDIALLLNKLNIEKIHLCGFSLGGMIACEFAVKYPQLVKSICIVNSLPFFNLNSPIYKIGYQIRRLITRYIPLSIIIIFMGWSLFPNHKELRKKLKKIEPEINRKGYIASLDAMSGWDTEDKFVKLNIPTLFIGSEFDYKIFNNKKSTVKKMKNAKYIEIKKAHHFVTWEYPQTFNAVYKKFLESLEKGFD